VEQSPNLAVLLFTLLLRVARLPRCLARLKLSIWLSLVVVVVLLALHKAVVAAVAVAI
jgi:hypothetical protein